MRAATPFVGPTSFTADQAPIFYGREGEAAHVVSLLIANRTVLVYAQSGAGKTSLIQAGLLPHLGRAGFDWAASLRVSGPTEQPEATDSADGPTAFEVNAAWHLADSQGVARSWLPQRPWLTDVLGALGDNASQPRGLLVFDQAEEVFTSRPFAPSARKRFFESLEGLLEHFDNVGILLALREEWLAALDDYRSRFAGNLRARLHLRGLRPDQARRAIEGPVAQVAPDYEFEEEATAALIQNLARERVEDSDGETHEVTTDVIEPVQLQVVCTALWGRLAEDTKRITQEHLDEIGSVDRALGDYYDACISDVAESREQERLLRNWFEHQLVTPAGTRGLVHLTDDGAGPVPRHQIETLQGLHILKLERHANSWWIELAHDRLIQAVREANGRWREEYQVAAEEAAGSTLSRLRLVGAVRVGLEFAKPFFFKAPDGRLTGEGLVMAQRVFRELGIHRIEPVYLEFQKLKDSLDRNRFDIASGGMFIPPWHEPNYLYSQPTVELSMGLLVQRGNPKVLHSLEDIRANPDVQLGFTTATLYEWICPKVGIPEAQIKRLPRDWMGRDAVKTGRLDAFLMASPHVAAFVEDDRDGLLQQALPFSDPIIDGEPYRCRGALMMRGGDTDLLEAVNGVLAGFVGTEEHYKLVAPFGITRDMLPAG